MGKRGACGFKAWWPLNKIQYADDAILMAASVDNVQRTVTVFHKGV